MSNRVVYGNSFSSNGWPMVDTGSCTWVTVPGTAVTLQIQNGWPLAILRAFAADFNAYVEPLRDADSGCWTATNSVSTSNHLSGTAMDLNWDSHPFQVPDAGFDAAKIATMRELLDFYEGMVFWGDDWTSPKDAMHLQLASLANGGDINTYNNPAVGDFIARKIRADGFSTYRRGDAPSTPSVLTVPLTQNANGTWTSPSPAWAHLIKRESGGNPTIIQQIIDVNSGGNEAEGLFQITPATWRAHNGTDFAASPRLATPQQQAIVAARIFTGNPSGSDWGAGLPGREDAQQLAAGLVPTADIQDPGDDDLSAEAEALIKVMAAKVDRLDAEWTAAKQGPTRSFFAPDQNPVDSPLGFLYNVDGNVWNQEVTWGYLFGVQRAEQLVNSVAQNGVVPSSWAGQLTDAQGAWLAEWGQQWCLGLISFRAGIQKAFKAAGAPVSQGATGDTSLSAAQAQDIANRAASAVASQVPAQVQAAVNNALPAPVALTPASVEVVSQPADEAEGFADLYRSLKNLGLADALPIEARAPLAAFISILQTKNGTQLGATS